MSPYGASSLGAMTMMSPHDVAGAHHEVAQAWMQPRLHPNMMQQVHHAAVPSAQGPLPVHQMCPVPGSESTPGFSAPPLPHQPAAGPGMVDAAFLEEPPRLPETAFAEELSKASELVAPVVPEAGTEEDEVEAEVELDMEDYDEEDDERLAQEIPQLEEMEAREDGDDAGCSPASAEDDKDEDADAAAGASELQDEGAGAADEAEDEVFARFADDEPRTWASMAGRLKQGGGQLGQSKVQGYGAKPGTAVAATSSKAQPSAAASSGSSGGAAARPQDRTADRGAGSERSAGAGNASTPLAPPANAYDVWLWVSRLPVALWATEKSASSHDTRAEGQEVLDCISSYLGDVGQAVDIERRDQNQEWANLAVSSQAAADLVLQLSRDRKLLMRGKPLKADIHKQSYSRRGGRSGGRASAEGASKGSGRGKGGAFEGGGDEDRSGDGRGKGRARRRDGRGGKGEGHSGDAAGRWTAPA